MSINWGWSPWLVVPCSLLIGGLCGLASGGITALLNVQPFIATLAMMVFARGLAKHISGGTKISTAIERADGSYQYVDVPGLFKAIDARIFGGTVSIVTV